MPQHVRTELTLTDSTYMSAALQLIIDISTYQAQTWPEFTAKILKKFKSTNFSMTNPSPRNSKINFKAIIVGGSVAGLTLAHMFECANIDYVLLEARDTISPSIGASIVIMPNGARILDQLGLYDAMKDRFMTGMRRTYSRRSDGRVVASTAWPAILQER